MTKITKQRFFVMSERKSPFPSLSSPDILILGRHNNGSDGETQKTCARVSDPGSGKSPSVILFNTFRGTKKSRVFIRFRLPKRQKSTSCSPAGTVLEVKTGCFTPQNSLFRRVRKSNWRAKIVKVTSQDWLSCISRTSPFCHSITQPTIPQKVAQKPEIHV